MTETPPEEDLYAPAPADALNEALVTLTGDIGMSLEGICSYSLTIGDSYVPFNPDDDDDTCEDEDEVACSQMWVRVVQIAPATAPESFGGSCAISLRITLEVGVLRCVPIPEGGEAPTASDVLEAAQISMDDMNTVQCAAMSSDAFDRISLGVWTPLGPQGGQYGGVWSFTADM